MPRGVPVTIRCHPNLFDHWRERLRRPATLEPHVSDVGALNPPGDSNATDGAATLAWRPGSTPRRWRGSTTRRAGSATRGRRPSSATPRPCPLVAARRAGIPGFLLANFTWADIYAPHARRLGGDAARLVAELRGGLSPGHRALPGRARAADGRRRPDRSRSGWSSTPGRNRRRRAAQAARAEPRPTGSSTSTSAGTARTTSAGSGSSGWRRRGSTSSGSTRRRAARWPTCTSSRRPSGPAPTSPPRPTRSWPRRATARPARRWSRAPR